MARPSTDIKHRILDAAIRVLKERGERALTQTQVARAAEIPQGHLTYYFPKKRDLIIAVAQRFAELTAADIQEFFGARAKEPVLQTLRAYAKKLSSDRERTRMLLGLLVISEDEPELLAVLQKSALGLRQLLAPVVGCTPDDEAVDLLLSLLWGIGLRDFLFRADDTGDLLERAIQLLATKNV